MRCEYRVVWVRENGKRKVKRFVSLKRAQRLLVLIGPEPWRAFNRNPDDLMCCAGENCGCGGKTWREHHLEEREGTDPMPPLASSHIEVRDRPSSRGGHLTLTAPSISRAWSMPSTDTFSIAPIADLLDRWLDGCECIVDPFARNSKRGTITNDLNPETAACEHLPASLFLENMRAREIKADAALLDPPYSYRQVVECYQSVGREFTAQDQQQVQRWTVEKNLLADILKPGGIAISLGWNSSGIGKTRGFELLDILLLNHGSAHHDTIVTVERKMPSLFEQEVRA